MTPARGPLLRHPDSKGAAIDEIVVAVTRDGANALHLTYRVIGDLERVVLPARAISTRTDELWRGTCFEAFVRTRMGEGYLEFNLSPSTQWAAYRFHAYRAGMAPLEIAPPRIDVVRNSNLFELNAIIDPAGMAAAPWRIGIAAIIEEKEGKMSYWALAHPPGRPDFHHADCFALELDLADLG